MLFAYSLLFPVSGRRCSRFLPLASLYAGLSPISKIQNQPIFATFLRCAAQPTLPLRGSTCLPRDVRGVSTNYGESAMDISIPGLNPPLLGTAPVVILGANGSGKTRLAVQMTSSGNAEFIGAVRNIAMPDQIPNWSLQTATNELNSRTNQRKNTYWELIPDIDALFGKLWSSHAVEAMRIYDQLQEGITPESLPETVLNKTRLC